MTLYDQHLHTWFSNDSQAEPAENVRQAVSRGLAGLTFTDHFDSHPTEWPLCKYDYDAIAAAVSGLRKEYGDSFFIGHGIEVCYQPEQMDKIFSYLDSHQFDLVLLSVHWFHGKALHERQYWTGLDTAAATREYLEAVLEAVQFVLDLKRQGRRPFDVLGHLDLVKRYTMRYFDTFDIRPCQDLVDRILRTCIEADLVPEVNLSTLRQSLPEPSPAEWVIGRYVKLGGRAMTLGSDAHRPEHVGMGVAEAAEMLKRQGIEALAVFRGRQRTDEPL
ncbi:MAG: histidinol-phosphatase HisJ family protein [Planctomycetes bacterium]|nr:histidinol-phosphatase HisJ family protein [Planctomycetota bacterium]